MHYKNVFKIIFKRTFYPLHYWIDLKNAVF